MTSNVLEDLAADFNRHVAFREKRPGVVQVLAPLYHEDGDMIDIFIDLPKTLGDPIRVSDHGLTLMRLSYTYEIETPTKRKILGRILSENGITEDRGRFFIEAAPEHVYPALLQLAQTIAKVCNMQAFKREVVQSLFYETLDDFVKGALAKYHPMERYVPIPERDNLEVDWRLAVQPRDIFLFGVRDSSKARLAALMCREFQLLSVPFRSVIVHEDFENRLSRKDQARITNAADKQFASLADFKSGAEMYFSREVRQAVQ